MRENPSGFLFPSKLLGNIVLMDQNPRFTQLGAELFLLNPAAWSPKFSLILVLCGLAFVFARSVGIFEDYLG